MASALSYYIYFFFSVLLTYLKAELEIQICGIMLKKNVKNLPFDCGDLQCFLSFSASKTEVLCFQKEADSFAFTLH